MPSLELAAGQVLTAAHTNTYWMRQVIATGLSSARPTGYEGRAVYDTDTDALMVYASPTTGWKPPWNLPWGYVGRAAITANSGAITTVADTGLSVTFNAVAGRRYRAEWRADFNQSVGTDLATAYLTDGAGGGIARELRACRVGDNYGTFAGHAVLSGLSGSTTLKLRAECSGGGNLIVVAGSIFPAELVITDIGPSGAPA